MIRRPGRMMAKTNLSIKREKGQAFNIREDEMYPS
jgi:hypothetical protein